jgi:SMP-30/Gluconolactonase/LRE-like region
MAITRLDVAQMAKGEGPVWDGPPQSLSWIDIIGKAVHRLHPQTRIVQSWTVPDMIGSMAIASESAAIIALANSVHRLNLETGAVTMLATGPVLNEHAQLADGSVQADLKRASVGFPADEGQKASVDTRAVGRKACENLKPCCRLMDRHSAAVQGATAFVTGFPQQRRFKRKIDNIRHPVARRDEFDRQGQSWIASHADGRGIDDSVSQFESLNKRSGCVDPAGVERFPKIDAQGGPLELILINKEQTLRPQPKQGMRGRRSCPAATDLDDSVQRRPAQPCPHALCKTRHIRVVTNSLTTPKLNCIDRSDLARSLGQIVEVRNHRLLEGEGNVEADITSVLTSSKLISQATVIPSPVREIEQCVAQRHTLRRSLLFMHPG